MLAFAGDSNLVDVEFKGNVPNFSYGGSEDTPESDGEGTITGSSSVLSGNTFTYNENLRIKVPAGTLQDYKTATVTLNGEEYYDTLETWFVKFSSSGMANESWLDVFYEE